MEWRDEGLVIGVRRHGEYSAIVEAMTRSHGRHFGLVRGGRSSRLSAALQPGNSLGLVWRARLDEHLGAYAVEPLTSRAGRLMMSAMALAGINYLGALMRLLPERDPHEAVYEALTLIVDRLDDSASRAGARRAIRGAGPGRVRLPARPFLLRCDRSEREPGLCVAAFGTGGEPRGRRAVARPSAAVAGFPAQGRRARGGAEHRGGCRRISHDRLLPAARRLRSPRRAAPRLPPRFSGGGEIGTPMIFGRQIPAYHS